MNFGIMDVINRRVAQAVAQHMDLIDEQAPMEEIVAMTGKGWYDSPMSDTFMGTNDATDADRAWLFGMFAARTPDVDIDTIPADFDWENLFSAFRAEILARRDPSTCLACAAEVPALDGVGSQ